MIQNIILWFIKDQFYKTELQKYQIKKRYKWEGKKKTWGGKKKGLKDLVKKDTNENKNLRWFTVYMNNVFIPSFLMYNLILDR